MEDLGYLPQLCTILQKTYDEHALGTRPWGVSKRRSLAGGCSYAAGCAIGISLTPATAERIDDLDPENYTIAEILDMDSRVRLELFGAPETIPDEPGEFLKQVQFQHDHCATLKGASDADKRNLYRVRLERLAELWGVPLEKQHAKTGRASGL